MSQIIYKIFRLTEWENAMARGVFEGSADDIRDGFIHFSGAEQVRTTCDTHFQEKSNLILAGVDPATLGDALKWEVSRGGAQFPHFYGVLRLSDVKSVAEISRDDAGRLIFPPEIGVGD
jgi:uncharacterized protein (DUF952 family)